MPGTCVSAGPSTEYRDADTDPQRVCCSDASCDVYASNTCTDCSSTYILDIAGACVVACPATQHGLVDTVLISQHRELWRLSVRHDGRDGPILDVTGACVSACPATRYGVVDTHLQCSPGSRELRRLRAQHVHRLHRRLHLEPRGQVLLWVPRDRARRRGH